MTAEPTPIRGASADADADNVRAVLLEIVDRALGEHAHETAVSVEVYARDIAHCSRATAYEGVRRGDVPSMRVAGRIMIPIPACAAQLLGAQNATKPALTEAGPVSTDHHHGVSRRGESGSG